MVTFEQIKAAWDKASDNGKTTNANFYSRFGTATGLSRPYLRRKHDQWLCLGRLESQAIADKHGTNLRDGGFQAYLAETWEEVHVADCWNCGEPPTSGWFLVRLDHLGNVGFQLFYCHFDERREVINNPDFLIVYMDQAGGDYERVGGTLRGQVTHHCEATPENFAMALAEIQELNPQWR
jgi:hypothetical protein